MTTTQRRTIHLIAEHDVGYTPVETIRAGGQVINRRTLKTLVKAGMIEGYDLVPYGPHPIYGYALTDEGQAWVKKHGSQKNGGV